MYNGGKYVKEYVTGNFFQKIGKQVKHNQNSDSE